MIPIIKSGNKIMQALWFLRRFFICDVEYNAILNRSSNIKSISISYYWFARVIDCTIKSEGNDIYFTSKIVNKFWQKSFLYVMYASYDLQTITAIKNAIVKDMLSVNLKDIDSHFTCDYDTETSKHILVLTPFPR